MENYLRFSLMGGQMRMKPGIVPHIFECQLDTKSLIDRNLPVKSENAQQKLQNFYQLLYVQILKIYRQMYYQIR